MFGCAQHDGFLEQGAVMPDLRRGGDLIDKGPAPLEPGNAAPTIAASCKATPTSEQSGGSHAAVEAGLGLASSTWRNRAGGGRSARAATDRTRDIARLASRRPAANALNEG
jgi:hypothetical protein